MKTKCRHGWTVQLPDFTCPVSSCPANVPPAPEPPPQPKYAHAIRYRAQEPVAEWSDWHVFARLNGNTRGTRCRISVDLGPFSIERGALEPSAGAGKCTSCFT